MAARSAARRASTAGLPNPLPLTFRVQLCCHHRDWTLPRKPRHRIRSRRLPSSLQKMPGPPPGKNPTHRWTIAAVAAALVLLAGIVAIQFFGTPSFMARLGLPVGTAEVPLLLEVPRKPERRTLESGNELFAINGRIINPTDQRQRVPDILAELRDAQGRVVYSWTIMPPRRTIGPKGTAEFNSAEVDVPKGARALNLSFSGSLKN